MILAAGASSRMRGSDKLLETIDGTPIILRAVRAACAVSPRVIVALPPVSARRAWLGDTPARLVEVADREMSASIRATLLVCDAAAAMIHLADLPEIGAPEMQALAEAWQATDDDILRATAADGTPGQPVIFSRRHFPALLALAGDRGARDLLARFPARHVPLPGRRALVDLDTPEDWAAWRAANH